MSEGLDIDELQTLRAFPIVIPAFAGMTEMMARLPVMNRHGAIHCGSDTEEKGP
jgi:hypothetical protein